MDFDLKYTSTFLLEITYTQDPFYTDLELLRTIAHHKPLIVNRTDLTIRQIAQKICENYFLRKSCTEGLYDQLAACLSIKTEANEIHSLYQEVLVNYPERTYATFGSNLPPPADDNTQTCTSLVQEGKGEIPI